MMGISGQGALKGGLFEDWPINRGFSLAKSLPDQPARIIELAAQPTSNQEIIRGLAHGDKAAARALYDRFGDMVNNLVWRLMGTDMDHDDVVQQAFLNVIASIGRIENPQALSAWVIRITVNTVRKEIRSKKYRRILRLEPDLPDVPSSRLGPESQAVVRSFYSVVNRMGATERIHFVLRFVEGYTVREIASMLACSPTTVKRKVSRAREFFMKEARQDSFLASALEEPGDE